LIKYFSAIEQEKAMSLAKIASTSIILKDSILNSVRGKNKKQK